MALGAGMGIGRFVYTPILPLMHAQLEISAGTASALATANYIGYLLGAVAGVVVPGLTTSRRALRIALVVVVASLALMPSTTSVAWWSVFRVVGGAASAQVFVVAVTALVRLRSGGAPRLAAAAIGGVGVGIAVSAAALLLFGRSGSWVSAWLLVALIAACLTIVAWPVRLPQAGGHDSDRRFVSAGVGRRWFWVLLVSYSLEGVGYIVAATFLVAAVVESSSEWVGNGAWLVVGLAAAGSCAVWFALGARWSLPSLLLSALILQACGIALPAAFAGPTVAIVGAVLFGGTFLGVAAMSTALGGSLRRRQAVPILTAGYGIGQIVGPVVVAPVIGEGSYRGALAVGAGIVVLSAVGSGVLRLGVRHSETPPSNL